MDVAGDIRRFIQDELLFGDIARPIGEETPLCEGVIDSIGLMELVAFLERRFNFEIDEAELTADNFRTIAAIERLVSRREAGA